MIDSFFDAAADRKKFKKHQKKHLMIFIKPHLFIGLTKFMKAIKV